MKNIKKSNSDISTENDKNTFFGISSDEQLTISEWQEKVIKYVDKNHIWLNSFSCVNPTKDFCEQLGSR